MNKILIHLGFISRFGSATAGGGLIAAEIEIDVSKKKFNVVETGNALRHPSLVFSAVTAGRDADDLHLVVATRANGALVSHAIVIKVQCRRSNRSESRLTATWIVAATSRTIDRRRSPAKFCCICELPSRTCQTPDIAVVIHSLFCPMFASRQTNVYSYEIIILTLGFGD